MFSQPKRLNTENLVIRSFGERACFKYSFPHFARKKLTPREERDREMKQDRLRQNISYSLNLSQEQKIKILEVWEKYRPNIRDLQDQMEEARISLWKLSFETPSEEVASEIRTKIEEINSLEQKIQESRNAMFQKCFLF